MGSNPTALAIFITCFIVCYICALFIPCAIQVFNDPNNESNCVNDNTVTQWFKSVSDYFQNTAIDIITGIISLITTAIQSLLWVFGLNTAVNLILMPIRLAGLLALYVVVTPTK